MKPVLPLYSYLKNLEFVETVLGHQAFLALDPPRNLISEHGYFANCKVTPETPWDEAVTELENSFRILIDVLRQAGAATD